MMANRLLDIEPYWVYELIIELFYGNKKKQTSGAIDASHSSSWGGLLIGPSAHDLDLLAT